MRDVGIEAGMGEAGKAVLDLVSLSYTVFRVEATDGCQPGDCLDVPDDDYVPTTMVWSRTVRRTGGKEAAGGREGVRRQGIGRPVRGRWIEIWVAA
jgi:hypothetical protein